MTIFDIILWRLYCYSFYAYYIHFLFSFTFSLYRLLKSNRNIAYKVAEMKAWVKKFLKN